VQTSRHGRRSGALRSAGARRAVWDTGGPCTRVIFGASGWAEGGRASALALWRIVVVLDGHHRGMRSTYLTAAAFCKPPSPVSQISGDAIAQVLSEASPPSRNRDSAKCVSSTPHSSRSPSGQTNGPIPRAGRPHGQDPMPRDRTLMVSMRPTRALRGWHLNPQPTHSGDSRSSARRNAMWPCARPSSRRSRSHRRCACG
jgi:hypothetical protein